MPLKWRLPIVMLEKEVNHHQLAEATGMHPNTVNRLKNHMPEQISRKTLEALCSALDCQPGDLIVFNRE